MEAVDVEVLLELPEVLLEPALLDDALDEEVLDEELDDEALEDDDAVDVLEPRESVR